MIDLKKQPHIHAEVIKAWADGAEIESYRPISDRWLPCNSPQWLLNSRYRVKPEPHKWQKEMDAYVAGKMVQYRLLMWPEHQWENLPGFRKNKETPEFQFSGTANAIFRIKPEPVVHYLSVDVRGSKNVLYHIEQGLPTPHNCTNLKLTFEDGKLIGAEVLSKC
jgi:hypothetical protein